MALLTSRPKRVGFQRLHFFFCSLTSWEGRLTTTSIFNFWSSRLEDAVSREDTERTEKLEKWGEITENASRIIVDGRSKLDGIKSKDPQTTPEIQKELQEIQVKTFYADVARSVKIDLFLLITSTLANLVTRYSLTHSLTHSLTTSSSSPLHRQLVFVKFPCKDSIAGFLCTSPGDLLFHIKYVEYIWV